MKIYFVLISLAALISTASADPVDEPCTIDANLRVTGTDKKSCVEKLEIAAKVARAEFRVNSGMKRKGRKSR